MKLSRIKAMIMASVLMLCAWSCATDDCTDNRNALPLAGFYSSATDQAVSVDSITIFGIGAPGDSLLLKNARNVNRVYLPLRIDNESTSFVIHYMQKELDNPRFNDTITFVYRTIRSFPSAACGASFRYEMEKINCTTHLIDSVTCPLGFIDNANVENIRIYFRTPAEEEPGR